MPPTPLTSLRESAPAILPSLLQCDFGNLEREVRALEAAGVAALHLDVMDGHFVPNLTYGMPIVASLRDLTELTLDVHLMIANPLDYAAAFRDAGADIITVHVEAVSEPVTAVREIQSLGVGAGLAINPHTPFEKITAAAAACDIALVMSVPAGFGGQPFDSCALQRLADLRRDHPDLVLEVDGGVNIDTIGRCTDAGADLLVVGSAIFRHASYSSAIDDLSAAAKKSSSAS